MHTTPLKLVTIVAEALLADRLTAELHAFGATGWTLTEARGDGARGMRTGPIPGENVRIESVVTPAVAGRVLAALATEWYPNYAVVAWVADVAVVRGEKVGGAP